MVLNATYLVVNDFFSFCSYDIPELKVKRIVPDILYAQKTVNDTTENVMTDTDFRATFGPLFIIIGACLAAFTLLLLCTQSNTCYLKHWFIQIRPFCKFVMIMTEKKFMVSFYHHITSYLDAQFVYSSSLENLKYIQFMR